jgi:branched-chain amino acid transport system permease protein
MDYFLGLLINGILVGSIYSMVALGFVLIYKASKVLNFAQGELLMIGAYICLEIVLQLQTGIIGAFMLTLILMAVMAVLIERLVLRRMMNSPVMSVVMVTIGIGIILRSIVLLVWGPITIHFPVFIQDVPVDLGVVRVSVIYIYSFLICIAFMVVFGLFFRYTQTGLVMRAAASSQVAARSVGIPLHRVFALAWVVAAIVSAAGGVITGNISGLTPELSAYGVRVFPAVILGGLDSIVGTTIAGVLIGVMEELGGGYLRDWTGFSGLGTVAPFIVLILILWIRPHGLMGTKDVERI